MGNAPLFPVNVENNRPATYCLDEIPLKAQLWRGRQLRPIYSILKVFNNRLGNKYSLKVFLSIKVYQILIIYHEEFYELVLEARST